MHQAWNQIYAPLGSLGLSALAALRIKGHVAAAITLLLALGVAIFAYGMPVPQALVGRESELFRFTVKHSLLFAIFIGLITLLQAYVLTGMVPQ